MKILIACEFSGIVREAFKARGHDAWSCDFLPTEIPGQHIQGDVLEILGDGWDMMIAHPPCTFLAKAGLHYLKSRPERMADLVDAYNFVLRLWFSSIDKVCIENPPGWLCTNWQKPSQIIQPYYFGQREMKETCLWLKKIPPLLFTDIFQKPDPKGFIIRKSGPRKGEKFNYHWRQGKTAHERSKTFPGIAAAMAAQWGNL